MAALQEYFDIVVIGKDGFGKRTTVNKILRVESMESATHRLEENAKDFKGDCDEICLTQTDKVGEFQIIGKSNCELISNTDLGVRVVLVSGFADCSHYKERFHILRKLSCIQTEKQLKINRVVYFLPVRGTLEKADGRLIEQLETMNHFYGCSIFKCMVIVATCSPRKRIQDIGFDHEDIERTRKVFHVGLKRVVKDENIGTPPVIFVGTSDGGDEILKKIRTAIQQTNDYTLPTSSLDITSCTHCSSTVLYSGEEKIGVLIESQGELIPYNESKCHPNFVPRYSTLQKAMDSVGISYALSYVTNWSGLSNTVTEEICQVCQQSPKSPGCSKVAHRFFLDSRKEMDEDHQVDDC